MAENRAPIGVALIARDASATIGKCLESIRPFVEQIVVGVDELTADDTAAIATEAGADVVYPIAVSHTHECEHHGAVPAQHFADARNDTFSRLDPDLPFRMWIDSDDVAVHFDRVPQMLAGLDPRYIGIWLPYEYATMQGGEVCNTVFHRERILRASVGWNWEYRVHEVVRPATEGPWFGTTEVIIRHQEGVHKTHDSAKRNLLLLEIDLESDPNDTRATFYMGNQYFAMGQWRDAINWYEQLLRIGTNVYERWQSANYLSVAYEQVGDLTLATQAAHVALDERPNHPEPYFRLARIKLLEGKFDDCEFWTKLGREREEPPFFVFKNPLDYSYNNRTCLADAYAQMGRTQDAKAELEEARKVLKNETVEDAIKFYDQLEANAKRAELFITSVTQMGLPVEKYYEQPADVRMFSGVRNLAIPELMRARSERSGAHGAPRIVFWCGRSLEEWHPGSLQTGIGGSETAVIQIAHRFARDGWQVDVYNGAGRFEGIYDGVAYLDPERFDGATDADVWVSWRQPRAELHGKLNVLWCHDLNYGPDDEGHFHKWGAVLGVSMWHASMLHRYYGVDAKFVPNGIDLGRFESKIDRVPMRCIYASSPDRGLSRLLALWPKVVEAEPGAELHLGYGWENIDRLIAAGRSDLAGFRDALKQQIETTKGVVWHGRLGQGDLAHLYQSSYAWLYPTDFLEVSCISAMEAMAAGAVPVASSCGALTETVGDAGLLLPGQPSSRAWNTFYPMAALGVLTDPARRLLLSEAGKERSRGFSWENAYKAWLEVLEPMMAGREPDEDWDYTGPRCEKCEHRNSEHDKFGCKEFVGDYGEWNCECKVPACV